MHHTVFFGGVDLVVMFRKGLLPVIIQYDVFFSLMYEETPSKFLWFDSLIRMKNRIDIEYPWKDMD